MQGSKKHTGTISFASPSHGAPFESSLIGFDDAARVKKFRLTQTRSDELQAGYAIVLPSQRNRYC